MGAPATPPFSTAASATQPPAVSETRTRLDKAKGHHLRWRHQDSDIVLDDVTVSRRHAEFRATGEYDVQVVDVGGLDGTYVNGLPVDTAVRANGDEVQLGNVRLMFLSGPAVERTE